MGNCFVSKPPSTREPSSSKEKAHESNELKVDV